MEKHIDIVKMLFLVVAKSIDLQILLLSVNHRMIYMSLNPTGEALNDRFDFRLIGVLVHQLCEYLCDRPLSIDLLWDLHNQKQYK